MHSIPWPPIGEILNSVVQWPVAWTGRAIAAQAAVLRQLSVVVQRPSPGAFDRLVAEWQQCSANATSAPFDLVRSGYAIGVQCGLIERSLLASAAFARQVAIAERRACGPCARTD